MPSDDDRYVARRDYDRDLSEIRAKIAHEEERRKEEIAARWQRFEDLTALKLDDPTLMEQFRAAIYYAWKKVEAMREAQAKSPFQRLSAILIALGAVAGAVAVLWPLVKHGMEAILGAK